MPRSLVSFWKRVATSGPTVDGRVITPQELRDIAETYSTATYTATIWSEHERWPGSYGTVFAVRLVEDVEGLVPGQVALEAQLKPNQKLLWLNDQGEKLFTSIEIMPDFAGTGRAYLTGLAVTDEPASLGTQELYFSRKTGKPVHYAAAVPFGTIGEEESQGELAKLFNLFSGLFKRFGIEEVPEEPTPQTPTESKPPMDEATAKALQALIEQQLIVAAGIQALIDSFAEAAPEPDQAPIDDVQAAVDGIVATAEEEKQLSRKGATNAAVLAGMSKLQAQFTALLDKPDGRHLSRTTGAADPKTKRVL
ncbi:GPO family capsid scaffolding protein [Pseudomonas viridiflava]|uniref:GPO family capsid scaffolding protein n=1 Tax=Pseudomonas viridiflava TaxID=33069 RepID=UPI001C31BE7A|nr:GPO family capsid scaffolding protein [Pseudomonas viridiflava]MEE4922592.1 GPO family capsid scaffolding protein [Pseudomonas alliivorans]QXG47862.1 GPO family capsid scaffolding protein [Pseudomonas viridiflava]